MVILPNKGVDTCSLKIKRLSKIVVMLTLETIFLVFIHWIRLLIIKRDSKFPFIISNTNRSDNHGMHWRSILDLLPIKEIFFLTLWTLSYLRKFVIHDVKKLINMILLGLENQPFQNKILKDLQKKN